jgi:hypothetical protein
MNDQMNGQINFVSFKRRVKGEEKKGRGEERERRRE